MKKYEEKIWNEMITGPSYFDDDEESKFEPAECLIEHEDWVICMEGRRVYWLIFRFIGHVWGYHEDNKKDLKPLVEWATYANNRQ